MGFERGPEQMTEITCPLKMVVWSMGRPLIDGFPEGGSASKQVEIDTNKQNLKR